MKKMFVLMVLFSLFVMLTAKGVLAEEAGTMKWRFKTGSEVNSSPAVSGNTVYVGSEDGFLYALDKKSGDLKWKFQTGSAVNSSPVVSGDTVYVGSEDGYVYAVQK
jgi:outer membrane protein assembly factor BamB